MHFEYEITSDEYVASQALYCKLQGGRRQVERAAFWILSGLFFIVIAWNDSRPSLTPILIGAIGIWWTYAGIRMVFPSRYFRRAYRTFAFAGTKFKADIDESGFEIKSDFCEWIVRWPGVQLKGDDERVFIFVSGGTIFIFGKKYLNSEQQEELRRLSGLAAAVDSPPITTH